MDDRELVQSAQSLNVFSVTSTLATVLLLRRPSGLVSVYAVICFVGWFLAALRLSYAYYTRRRLVACAAFAVFAVCIGAVSFAALSETNLLTLVATLTVVQSVADMFCSRALGG